MKRKKINWPDISFGPVNLYTMVSAYYFYMPNKPSKVYGEADPQLLSETKPLGHGEKRATLQLFTPTSENVEFG